MKVSEVMTSDVQFINKTKTVQEAAKLMEKNRIGAVPVEENDKLIGMITDRDITLKLVAHGKDPKNCQVSECMNSGIKYCYDDEDTKDVSQQMMDLNVRRMPVMSREKKLVGIVTLGDIAVNHTSSQEALHAFQNIERTN